MDTELKIQKMREEIAALEKQAAKEAKEKLLALPAAVGLKNVTELVKALLPYAKGLKLSGGAEASAKAARAVKKGKRAKITEEIKKAILEDLKGGATAAAAADKHGVSVASVNLIKSAAGLVKKRKKAKS